MRLSTDEIAAILAPSAASAGQKYTGTVRGYSIDSRSVERGDLFFALRGPRFDGHEFVPQALDRGAAAAVVREGFIPAVAANAGALIRVPDPEQALQNLARESRRRWSGRLIGVTGSTGKTTTKEMIAAVLARRYKVLKTEGNLNNHLGVPLTLLRLEPELDAAVVEMGMSGPGEIARLAEMAAPQTGVVTNVAPVHLEFFDSIDGIARAKRELIEHLQPPATAVLNHDDERVIRFGEGFSGAVISFGFSEGSGYRALRVRSGESLEGGSPTTEFEVEGPERHGWFSLPLTGRHNVENALAALACGGLFGVSASEMRAALAGLRLPGKRAEVIRVAGNVTLINDSYNSNPLAMERMIETLAAWPGAGRRLAIAGEMLELGPSSLEWHRRIGQKFAQAGVDALIAVCGDARGFIEGAAAAGMPPDRAVFFDAAKDAGRYCRSIARPGDVILIKGSRAVKLEEAVDAFGGPPPKPVWRDS